MKKRRSFDWLRGRKKIGYKTKVFKKLMQELKKVFLNLVLNKLLCDI